jgi:hypothetical protein
MSSILALGGCEDLEREHPELVMLATAAILIGGGALCLDARSNCLDTLLEDEEEDEDYGSQQAAYRQPAKASQQKQALEGTGEFEPSNVDELCVWAEGGDGQAQSAVGTFYRYGLRPFDLNPVLAYKWYSLSIASGHEEAQAYRDNLAQHMTQDAISEGDRLAQSWDLGDCLREVAASE